MNLISKTCGINEISTEDLNTFLLSRSYSLLYTSIPYLKMLESFLKAEILLLMVYDVGGIVGFLPLAFKRCNEYGTVCNSLPFYGSNGGLIVSDHPLKAEIRRKLIDQCDELLKEKKCLTATIISNPLDQDSNLWLKENFRHNLVDERIGQITHLPNGNTDGLDQELMDSFEDPRPRNIRKAKKEGVEVLALNSMEALDFLYATHFENITAISGIPKEKRFFEIIPEYFSNSEFKVYIAKLNGEMIAGLLLFFYNKTVEYFTPAVVEQYRNQQPSALLIYEAMLDAARHGYKNWNWGGTWLSQKGVYDFKKKWGTSEYPYYYYTRVCDETVLKLSKQTLLKNFSYFFVLPFSALINDKEK